MEETIMKKSMFIIAALILASSYVVADDNVKVGNQAKPDKTLQENAIDPGEGYAFHEGDTIVISKKMTHYLTGEEPSTWVYYVRHIIQQIGGKRFPNGMLVKGIISWIGPEDALLVGAVENTPEAQARIERDREQVKQQQQDLDEESEQEKKDVQDHADNIDTTPITDINDTKVDDGDNGTVIVEDATQPADTTAAVAKEKERKPQVDRFTIGVRGGMASLMQNTRNDMKKQIGFDVLLDLQYAHYWADKKENLYGLLVGVSAGFAQGGLKDGIDETYTLTSPGGETVQYKINADKVNETNRQIQLEVPIMFSMVMKNGFFMNLGPRIMLPVYTPYKEKFTNTDIVADFTDWGVQVPNELATGKMLKEKFTGKTDNKMKLNILLGLELGYEWTFSNDNSLGLGVYANYGWSLYKHDSDKDRLIDVQPASPSVVNVYSASDAFTKKMGYLDAGVKLAYHFNWWKNRKPVTVQE